MDFLWFWLEFFCFYFILSVIVIEQQTKKGMMMRRRKIWWIGLVSSRGGGSASGGSRGGGGASACLRRMGGEGEKRVREQQGLWVWSARSEHHLVPWTLFTSEIVLIFGFALHSIGKWESFRNRNIQERRTRTGACQELCMGHRSVPDQFISMI